MSSPIQKMMGFCTHTNIYIYTVENWIAGICLLTNRITVKYKEKPIRNHMGERISNRKTMFVEIKE